MENINFTMLFRIFMKRLWVIALAFVIAVAAAYSYCTFIVKPVYSATASILVTNGALTEESPSEIRSNVNNADISASLDLVDTVTDILKTSGAAESAAKISNGKYKKEDFKSVKISRRGETTLFIDISFSDSNGNRAKEKANCFATAACGHITEIIPNSKAHVGDPAENAKKIYPRTFSTMATAGVFAVAIVYILFLIPEIVNRVIRDEDDFAKSFDLPIIGSIPSFDNSDTTNYTAYRKGK